MDPIATVNAKTREAYDRAADRYDALFHDELDGKPFDRALLDHFAASLRPGALICDAGCGPSGHIGSRLAGNGLSVVGMDISDRCIVLARRRHPTLHCSAADIGRMPVRDGTFEGLVAYYSIIDTPKAWVGRLFAEFRRVLRPGGLCLVAAKAGHAEGYQPDLLGIQSEIYMSLFSPEEIRRHALEAGFTILRLERRAPTGTEIPVDRIYVLALAPVPSDGGGM